MIPTSILAAVDNERLHRGVERLTAGAYRITLTRQTEQEISACVTNCDGQTYSVTLTDGKAFCGCGDSTFRGKTCKHSAALALYAICNTPEGQAELPSETPKPFNLKLAKVRRTA